MSKTESQKTKKILIISFIVIGIIFLGQFYGKSLLSIGGQLNVGNINFPIIAATFSNTTGNAIPNITIAIRGFYCCGSSLQNNTGYNSGINPHGGVNGYVNFSAGNCTTGLKSFSVYSNSPPVYGSLFTKPHNMSAGQFVQTTNAGTTDQFTFMGDFCQLTFPAVNGANGNQAYFAVYRIINQKQILLGWSGAGIEGGSYYPVVVFIGINQNESTNFVATTSTTTVTTISSTSTSSSTTNSTSTIYSGSTIYTTTILNNGSASPTSSLQSVSYNNTQGESITQNSTMFLVIVVTLIAIIVAMLVAILLLHKR